MFTRDYVMRQIHQLAQVLSKVLFNKRENTVIEINEIVSNGFLEALGVSLEDLLAMDESEIQSVCHKNGAFAADLAVSIADVLMQVNTDEAHLRAYWLYSAAAKAGGTLPVHIIEWISSNEIDF